MKNNETVIVTKEMLDKTKCGYVFMLELRILMSVYGIDGFNEKFGSNFSKLDDIPFDDIAIQK